MNAVDVPAVAAPGAHEPQLVLTWLVRLRWFAVAGQVVAMLLAAGPMRLELPARAVALVILVTALSNIALVSVRGRPWAISLVPGVLVLDLVLLTALLGLTGGPDNPFSTLYLVHVALAVVALSPGWTWGIAGIAVALYSLLYHWRLPFAPEPPAGEVLAAGRWAALMLATGLIAYFIGRLARERRQREVELMEAREAAARNQRLAALTTLAAGAAHELGTPLATIAVVAKELELSSRSADPAMAEDAQLIRREVDRCRDILARMRAEVAAEQAGEASGACDLAELLTVSLTDEERNRLEVRCEPHADGWAPAGLHAVQQAVGVLLRNAFDAAPAGPIALCVDRSHGAVRFGVEDHGCGMPDDILRRAGEPFFTTKPPGRGMGLGLFLVRLVAEKHGGEFKIESTPGRGTRCVLALPESRLVQTP